MNTTIDKIVERIDVELAQEGFGYLLLTVPLKKQSEAGYTRMHIHCNLGKPDALFVLEEAIRIVEDREVQ